MERLTTDKLNIFIREAATLMSVSKDELRKRYNTLFDRLQEFEVALEDTGLTPTEVAEYAKAKADGRAVIFPCKVGDTVYTNVTWSGDYERVKDRPYQHEVVFIGVNGEENFFHTVNQKKQKECLVLSLSISAKPYSLPEKKRRKR